MPYGWVEGKFADVIEVVRGVTFSKEQRSETSAVGLVPCLRSGNVQRELTTENLIYVPSSVVKSDDRYIKSGDTIISMSNSYELVGKVAVATDQHKAMTFGAFLSAVRSDVFDAQFLFNLLRAPETQAAIRATASQTVNISNLSIGGLADIHLPIAPTTEQRRIVAKLDALTARLARVRAELDRVPVLTRRLREATLVHAFGAVVEHSWRTLGSLGLSIEAGKNLKCEERPPTDNERGVVKVSAVSTEKFEPTESKLLPQSYQPPERDRIVDGDLLLARASGSLGLVGRVAMAKIAASNLYLSDKVLRLRLPESMVSWVYWFLRSPVGRSQIESAASGISMHNITQPSLKSLKLPIPDEADRIAQIAIIDAAFTRADRLEAEAARARALIDRLESAILAKAFRGELVPQDPNDEPASVLLDRIRAERAAAPKAKRGRAARASA